MTEQANVFFKSLNEAEKQSKLTELSQLKTAPIVIWKKGTSDDKYTLATHSYERSSYLLRVLGSLPSELIGSDILYSFEINGLHFFGKCELAKVAEGEFDLNCVEELYKSERRNNFRLLTYPHHEVFFEVFVGKEKIEESNVLSFRSGVSQTKLFHSFLEMVDEEGKKAEKDEDYLPFRVLDISVTGLALQFSRIEAELFEEKQKLLNSALIFNGEKIDIPESEILYFIDSTAIDKKTKLVKAGLRFLNIDTNLDEKLSRIINQTLKSVESDFEDFIK